MGSAIARFFAGLFIVVAIIWVIGIFFGALQSINRTGPTTVSVVRNGGPFDSRDIREVRAPSQSVKVSGLYSEARDYIAGNEQRFYKVSSDPSLGKESGAAFIKVPTRDGVLVEVDAQITFRTNLTSPEAVVTPCEGSGCKEYEYLVEKFDTEYGNRNYSSKTGGTYKVWEGNSGWNAFLDQIFRPVVENAFREQIGAVNCADLVSSCALVQSTAQEVKLEPKDNQANFEEIQNNVQDQISEGVVSALGDDFLTGFKVQLTKVNLPESVQGAINSAQASFADISKARAQRQQAQFQAEGNEIIAKSLQASGDLVYLKAAEALADNASATIILGEPGTGLTLGRK